MDKENCCIKWGDDCGEKPASGVIVLYSFSCSAIFFFQCSNSNNNLLLRPIQQTRSTIRSLLLYSWSAFIMLMVQSWNSAYRLYRNTIMREPASRIHYKSLNCQKNGAFCLFLRYLVRFDIYARLVSKKLTYLCEYRRGTPKGRGFCLFPFTTCSRMACRFVNAVWYFMQSTDSHQSKLLLGKRFEKDRDLTWGSILGFTSQDPGYDPINCSKGSGCIGTSGRPKKDLVMGIYMFLILVCPFKPIFGPLRQKLAVITSAWFNQRDFTQLGILHVSSNDNDGWHILIPFSLEPV